MNDLHVAILRGLADQIRSVTAIFVSEIKTAARVADSVPRLVLSNFQGSIWVTAFDWGLHVMKVGHPNDDATYDYSDSDLIETVIARCLYLQDIDHHLRNRKIREDRARGAK